MLFIQAELSKDASGLSQILGSILLTAAGRILILDTEGRLVVNQTFPHMEHLPLKSAMSSYQTARMAVINGFAYIGGGHGVIYLIKLPVDYLDTVSTGAGSYLDGKYTKALNVSNITLPYPCIVEMFTYTQTDGVIAACFDNTNSTLYVVNVHSPSRSSMLQFTSGTDFSNVLQVDDAFYFVQHDQLFRADLTRGETAVKTLQYCGQAWLKKNEGYAIIIDCTNTSRSIVYVPQEWSSADGIKHGGWTYENVYLESCYSTHFIFSVDEKTVTLYDIRNDFKTKVTLKRNPETETLRCSGNDSNLVLINQDRNFSCWIQHPLTGQHQIETFKFIPYSEGTLPPLAVGHSVLRQNPLLLHGTKFLLPAKHQLLFDPQNNIVHDKITNDVVVFHAAISKQGSPDGPMVKPVPNDDQGNNSGAQWPIYVVVVLALVVVFIFIGGVLVNKKQSISSIYNKYFRR